MRNRPNWEAALESAGVHAVATISEGLAAQWDRAWMMLLDALSKFPEEEWRAERGQELSPARVAFHTVEPVDFYRGEGPAGYRLRFPVDWEDGPSEELPSAGELADWARELRAAVDAQLRAMSDAELLSAANPYPWTGANRLEHWLYGLRHLHHHLGELHGMLRRRGLPLEEWH